MVQLSVDGGHFTSAEKVGDDTRRVKYLGALFEPEECVANLTFEPIFQGLSLHRGQYMYTFYLFKTHARVNRKINRSSIE